MKKIILFIVFITIGLKLFSQDASPLPSATIKKLVAPNTPIFYYNHIDKSFWVFKGETGWLRLAGYYDTKERIDSVDALYRIPEAPADHKIYGRKDSTWVEVASGSGIIKEIFNEIPSGLVNGVNIKFALDTIPVANTERLFLNGIRQLKNTDYTIALDTISFSLPPEAGDLVTVDYMKSLPIVGNYYFNVTPTGDINGINGQFIVDYSIEPPTSRIYINGIRQYLTTDYTVSGNIINFVVAPETNDVIIVDYINIP